jgi:outer membrane protein OmpA-like peptidoglycan-associated protein
MGITIRLILIALTIGIFGVSLHNYLDAKKHSESDSILPFKSSVEIQAEELSKYYSNVFVNHALNFINVTLDDNSIQFAFNSYDLDYSAKNKLQPLIRILKASNSITISGHTCSMGDEEYNIYLSLKRAESVKFYIQSQNSEINKIRTFGYGEMNPIADNDTPDGRRKNRRVEIKIEHQPESKSYDDPGRMKNPSTDETNRKNINQIVFIISLVASLIQIFDFIMRYIIRYNNYY